jgi:hypothetical protein
VDPMGTQLEPIEDSCGSSGGVVTPEALRPLRLSPKLSPRLSPRLGQGMSGYRIRAVGARHRVLAVAAGSTESIRSRLMLVSAGCRGSLVHQRLQVDVRLSPRPGAAAFIVAWGDTLS